MGLRLTSAAAELNSDTPPDLPDPNLNPYDFSGSIQYLFNRVCNISFLDLTATGKVQKGLINGGVPLATAEFSKDTFSQLRVEFMVEKTALSTANKGKISIYNLSDLSRDTYVKGQNIVLEAGYTGNTSILFTGVIVHAENVRKGSNIVSIYECSDGAKELYSNTINKSYPAGTPILFVINDLVKNLTSDSTTLTVGDIDGISPLVYNSGLVLSGSVKTALDNLTAKLNLQWSVQNGVVNITPIVPTSTQISQAVFVNQTSGLIGVPNQSISGDNLVTFQSLMNPKLVPGALVNLQARFFSGIFSITTIRAEGDTHGNKWFINCECLPVPSANAGAQNALGTT